MYLGLSGDAFLTLVIIIEVAIVVITGVVLYFSCSVTQPGTHERRATHARQERAWYHTRPAQGVREAQGEDGQEVCGAHRQRRQDQERAQQDGEEGSAYTLAP